MNICENIFTGVIKNCIWFLESRGPAKRKVKPVEPQSLLDFDLGEGESSDDSDFRIEDHPEESDDYSINSDDDKSIYFF